MLLVQMKVMMKRMKENMSSNHYIPVDAPKAHVGPRVNKTKMNQVGLVSTTRNKWSISKIIMKSSKIQIFKEIIKTQNNRRSSHRFRLKMEKILMNFDGECFNLFPLWTGNEVKIDLSLIQIVYNFSVLEHKLI